MLDCLCRMGGKRRGGNRQRRIPESGYSANPKPLGLPVSRS